VESNSIVVIKSEDILNIKPFIKMKGFPLLTSTYEVITNINLSGMSIFSSYTKRTARKFTVY
jgi:hypothetical protein